MTIISLVMKGYSAISIVVVFEFEEGGVPKRKAGVNSECESEINIFCVLGFMRRHGFEF
jgi:hypothetical protein